MSAICPGATAPTPSKPDCVSPPPTATGDACRQPQVLCRCLAQLAQACTGWQERRENPLRRACCLDQVFGPLAGVYIEQAAFPCLAGLGGDLTGQQISDPIADAQKCAGITQRLGLVRLEPHQARAGKDRPGVMPGAPGDLSALFHRQVHAEIGGACVDIGHRREHFALPVDQDRAKAEPCRGDASHILRR